MRKTAVILLCLSEWLQMECSTCHKIQRPRSSDQEHDCDKRHPGSSRSVYRCVLRDCPSKRSRIEKQSPEQHFITEHKFDMTKAAGIVTHYYFPRHRNGMHHDVVGVQALQVKPGITPRRPFAIAATPPPPSGSPAHSANYARFMQTMIALPVNDYLARARWSDAEKSKACRLVPVFLKLFELGGAQALTIPAAIEFYETHKAYFDHVGSSANASTETILVGWVDFMNAMGLTDGITQAYATATLRQEVMKRAGIKPPSLLSVGFVPTTSPMLSILGRYALNLASGTSVQSYTSGLRSGIDDFIELFTPSSKVSARADKFRMAHPSAFSVSPMYPASEQVAFLTWHAYVKHMELDPANAAHYFGLKMREILVTQDLDEARAKFRIPMALLEATSLSPSRDSVDPPVPSLEMAAVPAEAPMVPLTAATAESVVLREPAPMPSTPPLLSQSVVRLSYRATPPPPSNPNNMSFGERVFEEMTRPDSPWKTKEGLKAFAIKDAAKGEEFADVGGWLVGGQHLGREDTKYYMQCYMEAVAHGEKRAAEDDTPLGASPPPGKKARIDAAYDKMCQGYVNSLPGTYMPRV